MNRLLVSLMLCVSIAPPAIAAEDHKPKNGGVVVETKAGDLELVAKPDVIVDSTNSLNSTNIN